MKKIIAILISICITFSCIFLCNYNKQEKEELQSVIEYQINSKNTYTPNSYNEYLEALDEALAIEDKFFVSNDEINAVRDNLEEKINSLYTRPDKTTLKKKYEELKNINTDLYLPNSIINLNESIENAYHIINDENALLEDVNLAINKMDLAILSLIKKPDKTSLTNLINQANNLDKLNYTTTSYNELEESIEDASLIINDNNATQLEVDNALENLKTSIDNLMIVSKGIYKITLSAYMLSNNHVGNEWGYSFYYNNQEITSGELITGIANSSITIRAEIFENDTILDVGTGYIELTLDDNNTLTKQITVRENRGRYYGNIAIWEVRCSVTLVETI